MRWTAAALLRPITFALAIAAAVVTGDRSDSFWLGLLAFFIAMGAGRVLGALVRGSIGRAVRRSIWPAAATGYAFLFAWVGLPPWANFLVTGVAALLTKDMLRDALPGRPRIVVAARQRRDWRGVVDLDELLP